MTDTKKISGLVAVEALALFSGVGTHARTRRSTDTHKQAQPSQQSQTSVPTDKQFAGKAAKGGFAQLNWVSSQNKKVRAKW